jgi:hypothetical protein
MISKTVILFFVLSFTIIGKAQDFQLGGELRQIHLLESPVVVKHITQYPEDGDNVVVKPRYEINPV